MTEPPTYAALCADIRAARGTWLMLQLIQDLKRLTREGAFDGTVRAEPGGARGDGN